MHSYTYIYIYIDIQYIQHPGFFQQVPLPSMAHADMSTTGAGLLEAKYGSHNLSNYSHLVVYSVQYLFMWCFHSISKKQNCIMDLEVLWMNYSNCQCSHTTRPMFSYNTSFFPTYFKYPLWGIISEKRLLDLPYIYISLYIYMILYIYIYIYDFIYIYMILYIYICTHPYVSCCNSICGGCICCYTSFPSPSFQPSRVHVQHSWGCAPTGRGFAKVTDQNLLGYA